MKHIVRDQSLAAQWATDQLQDKAVSVQPERCKADICRVDSPLGNPPQLRLAVIGVVR
ncbi:MAG: hypothetical protein Q7T96_09215 [Methylobacter sp.]|nr:hypothetical protein [Methylobacter sp.]